MIFKTDGQPQARGFVKDRFFQSCLIFGSNLSVSS